MKKIFRKNQIIITALALMIAVAGYINYTDHMKDKKAKAAAADEDMTQGIESETDAVSGDILSNDAEPDDNSIVDPGTAVFTSGSNSVFIVSAKLEREQVRASSKEMLLELINNENISESDKSNASAQMLALVDAAEREVAAELMLEAKGFSNVIVSIVNGKVDVVVEKESLTDTELAQIEDIVIRKTECSIDNLTISTVYEAN